jgi:predicted enzyme related to lactoylglutathione lyase
VPRKAVTKKAEEGGAHVRAEPFDSEAGRIAVLTDPHGAAFAVIGQAARPGGEDESDREEEEE